MTRRMRGEPGRLARLWHRVTPALLSVVIFLLTISGPLTPPMGPADSQVAGTTRLMLWIGFGLPGAMATLMLRQRRWPLHCVALLSWLGGSCWATVMLSAYHLAVGRPRRLPVGWAAAGLGAIVGISIGCGELVTSPPTEVVLRVFAGAMAASWTVALPFLLGLWVDSRRQVLAALRERAERLEREQDAQNMRARAQERNRIAREMHDVVAHRVALMVLHAGALEVNTADPKVEAAASLIRNTGREALTDLRQVLGVLRSSEGESADHQLPFEELVPQPTITDLEGLVDRARAAGLPVRLVGAVPFELVPASVGRTVFRLVQEALTNVIKHAGPAETRVELDHVGQTLTIAVINAPPVLRQPALPGSGLGLLGLRERVELVRGEFVSAIRSDGGFLVRATIPLEAGYQPG